MSSTGEYSSHQSHITEINGKYFYYSLDEFSLLAAPISYQPGTTLAFNSALSTLLVAVRGNACSVKNTLAGTL